MDTAPFDPGHLPDCHGIVLHSCKEFLAEMMPGVIVSAKSINIPDFVTTQGHCLEIL